MMETSILNQLPFDPGFLILGLIGLVLIRNFRASFQKFGMVKYNAFQGMGGNLSFVFALLDYTNTGFVLNCIHSREGCYIYMKEVDRGQTEVVLGNEEQEALEQALGYIDKQQ